MIGDFKATYCGAEYHNIDGTGWPDAVVMENQGSVLDGTYESRMYYPERTCKLDKSFKEPGFMENVMEYECSECGGLTNAQIFHASDEPRYCMMCGARVAKEEQ